ncbi:FAD-containing monooxygenase [Fusarium agapanthi]|uniref:FAD-containing monooxygenase n=1 Tax=Fusarium agapanthi TaxID=1803897 RepID=A0A9P5EA02_9HYPO|nr:FAD-containing monooxygenase [Fusarium agapanthi]
MLQRIPTYISPLPLVDKLAQVERAIFACGSSPTPQNGSSVTEDEIVLASGAKLRPDIIVTATGLKLRIGGGIQFFVDDDPVNIVDGFSWKGFMLQDVPNLAFVSGYYNAAWTLGAEVTGVAVVRLLRQMKSRGVSYVIPRLGKSDQNLEPQLFFKISSTYVKDAIKYTPKGGTGRLAHRWNYFFDLAKASWGDHKSDLEYF